MALSYQAARTLVFDFGMAHDLDRHTDEMTLFAGFAVLFERHYSAVSNIGDTWGAEK